jgi:hypothetical protein
VLAAANSPRSAEFLTIAHTLLTERASLLGDAERASFSRERTHQSRCPRRLGGGTEGVC